MDAVVLQGVNKSFAGVPACSQVDLSIEKGEFFTLLGPSGCGKTTLLRLIAGFISPQSGAIYLDGQDITRLAPEQRKVGMVFQNYSLFPYLTVYQNIEYGLAVQKKPRRERRRIVALYMDMVGLADFGGRKVTELSGGEQQRVALARSLAVEPSVLLLDEPLSNLDARLRDKMRTEIKSLQQRLGITFIFVTHDQTEALTLSDRIAVFNKGRIVQIGTPQEVYDAPRNTFVAGFIGDTNLFAAEAVGGRARLPGGLELRVPDTLQGSCHLSVRPQNIRLSVVPPGAAPDTTMHTNNTLEGRLVERQLNGVWIDSTVHVGETVLRAAELNTVAREAPPRPGDQVRVTIPEQAIRLLKD